MVGTFQIVNAGLQFGLVKEYQIGARVYVTATVSITSGSGYVIAAVDAVEAGVPCLKLLLFSPSDGSFIGGIKFTRANSAPNLARPNIKLLNHQNPAQEGSVKIHASSTGVAFISSSIADDPSRQVVIGYIDYGLLDLSSPLATNNYQVITSLPVLDSNFAMPAYNSTIGVYKGTNNVASQAVNLPLVDAVVSIDPGSTGTCGSTRIADNREASSGGKRITKTLAELVVLAPTILL